MVAVGDFEVFGLGACGVFLFEGGFFFGSVRLGGLGDLGGVQGSRDHG